MEVKIVIGENTEIREINENQTVKDMLEIMDVPSETVVVKKNNYIVIEEEPVADGDTIEIIQVIYGG
ncbi:MoaD/ThiS family protein [Methanobacterium paludis]|uniref:ThiamineS protein n=1 Tax=Methanobacterium paludis (strain DSM 25820 / JCM 18151 / SWAN1) TaxID=868131 RepID=F6D5V8_METPW|nr:MoaD/ThiS family protein [Methanobacterium paludis]AEG18911.1 thiamineS protein [Methanobacterium paludis]